MTRADRAQRREVLQTMLLDLADAGASEAEILDSVRHVFGDARDVCARVLGICEAYVFKLEQRALAKWAAAEVRAGHFASEDIAEPIRRAAARAGIDLGGTACA